SNRYRGIGRCNIALDALKREGSNLEENGAPLPSEALARYFAEIKFLRAWYYFDLITVFKEVPLLVAVEDPSTRKGKASIEELRNQLYIDLDEAIAEPNFPRSSELPDNETGRATKDAAYTLKARAALFFAGLMEQGKMEGDALGEYLIAKEMAGEVVNNGQLQLLPDFQDLFRGDYQVGPFS